ncbi:MAG TPA: hypothetical protein HA227_04475 [Candidatus Diapherotrites archaeon]|uniref:Uncharacterized protein n=1 Tax=Candidatus Iainarchaeum sp. TaxID=3101447 RepID=A0A7J4KWJ2_9ARCH|nr:hypothetical protein [Candidatus Diapherotrites archaeon]
MGSKPIIAGLIWLLLFLLNLLGIIGLVILSSVIPNFLNYQYLLFSTTYSIVFTVLFLILSVGLFFRRKWSFKLGIAIPIIDIIAGFAFSLILLIVPNILPKELEGQVGLGIIGTAIIAVVELIALILVLTSKSELTK